jgi:ABC-type glycerol-3-phosphate transport system substrate-binding protein
VNLKQARTIGDCSHYRHKHMERKSSSFQIILLCVFGAIGVAAILLFALATAGNSGGGISPVTMWGTLDATTMKNLLRVAGEQDSRLNEVTYVQKDPATYESDLANALASGQGPDIFIMQGDEAFNDANKVYTIPYSSLSQSQFQTTFVGGASQFLSQNGVLAIPILVDPLVLYWNTDSLASAGIAEPPQYWDQVPGDVALLTQKDDTGALQKEGIALGTYTNIDTAQDILAMLMEQAGAQITTENSSGTIEPALSSGGSASNAATQALEFYTEFANPSQPDYSWNDAQVDARQAFAAGELAMYVGYASDEALINAANPNLTYAAAAVPQIRNSATSVDEGTVYGLAIPKNDPNLPSALTIAYLLASESVDAGLSSAYGLAPARRDVIAANPSASSTVTADLPLFSKMALIVHSWDDPDPSQTGPIFQAMIEDTESGAMQAEDAVGRANEQIGTILQQAQPQ